MMFSSGMPLLYWIAAVFYAFYFFIYKVLLFKFYARTSRFSEDLPLESLDYMRGGTICHLFIGLLMFTNRDIVQIQDEQ